MLAKFQVPALVIKVKNFLLISAEALALARSKTWNLERGADHLVRWPDSESPISLPPGDQLNHPSPSSYPGQLSSLGSQRGLKSAPESESSMMQAVSK